MPGVNIEVASGLSTAAGCPLVRTEESDVVDLTGHQSYNSYIAELSRPFPIPRILRVVVAEVEQLLDSIIRTGMFRCRRQKKSTLFSYHDRSAPAAANAPSIHLPSFPLFGGRKYQRFGSTSEIDDGGIIVWMMRS